MGIKIRDRGLNFIIQIDDNDKCDSNVFFEAFKFFVDREIYDTSILRRGYLHVAFSQDHAVPRLDGYFESNAIIFDRNCKIWVRPSKKFESQLLTFFHELIHYKHYLENGVDRDDNEDEAYGNEERLLEEFLSSLPIISLENSSASRIFA